MVRAFAGRGYGAVMVAVLLSMLSVVNIDTKARASWLQRLRESALVAALFGVSKPEGDDIGLSFGKLAVSAALALALWLYGAPPESGVVVAMPGVVGNWQDLLDVRFARIHNDRYKQLADRIAKFFRVIGPGESPQRASYRTSAAGSFGDVGEFTGQVTYDDAYQGYDRTLTPKQYASGYQIERILFDHDEYGIMDAKPRGLATSAQRTRQKHAAQVFNNRFSVDTTWNNFTENVALCSNSHTTTAPGVSTATGFDNLVTTAFSAAALAAARIQMKNFRDDRGNRIAVNPTMILHPVDLYELVHEVVKSEGKPDTANNNANVHANAYEGVEWEYLSDTNDWSLIDPVMMKDSLVWYDELPPEFAMVEAFDELIGKWRLYTRYGAGHDDWRWILGAQVG